MLVAILGGVRPVQSASGLSPIEPIVCSSNQVIHLVERIISTDGDAVVASGRCKVYLNSSVVEAGRIAVVATNRAEVYVYDSTISGNRGSFSADNRAAIHFTDSEIHGRMRSSALGKIVDRGGNTIDDSGKGPVVGHSDDPEGALRIGGLIEIDSSGIRIGGGDLVEIDESGVKVGAGAVVVGEEGISVGSQTVVIDDRTASGGGREVVRVGPDGGVHIESGGETIMVDASGAVRVESPGETVTVDAAGNVRVESPGETVTIAGDWREGGTVYRDTDRVLVELNARTEDDRILVDLAGDIVFDSDSSAIRAEAAATLSRIAHVIRQRATGRVTIVGHTDSIGSGAYNQKLSEQRAVSVIRWLNQAEGIPVRLMTGIGAGSKQPIAYNTMPDGSDNPSGRAQNRRVEIQILTSR